MCVEQGLFAVVALSSCITQAHARMIRCKETGNMPHMHNIVTGENTQELLKNVHNMGAPAWTVNIRGFVTAHPVVTFREKVNGSKEVRTVELLGSKNEKNPQPPLPPTHTPDITPTSKSRQSAIEHFRNTEIQNEKPAHFSVVATAQACAPHTSNTAWRLMLKQHDVISFFYQLYYSFLICQKPHSNRLCIIRIWMLFRPINPTTQRGTSREYRTTFLQKL